MSMKSHLGSYRIYNIQYTVQSFIASRALYILIPTINRKLSKMNWKKMYVLGEEISF